MARQVGRGAAQHAAIAGRQRQGDQAGVLRLAVAQGNVHRLAEQVGDAVAEQQAQRQLRTLGLELVEPGQQRVAPEVRGRGDLQHAADLVAHARQLPASALQAGQGGAGVGQVLFALDGEAQAASGTQQQTYLQLRLQALERGAGHRGRAVQLTGSGGQATQLGSADEQGDVVEAQHGRSHFQKIIERDSMAGVFFSPAA